MPITRRMPTTLPTVTAWMSVCMLIPDWTNAAPWPTFWGTTALFGLVSSVGLEKAGSRIRLLRSPHSQRPEQFRSVQVLTKYKGRL